MGPIRDMISLNAEENAENWDEKQIRKVVKDDFIKALKNVKSSVSPSEIVRYREWNTVFGSFDIKDDHENQKYMENELSI